jgi:Ca2+:H+ antiporter
LNATFGNAVELLIAIFALVQNQVLIVQTSLIGSMLSNLLLVMGTCYFWGGLNRIDLKFNIVVAQTAGNLLVLAVGGLVIPTEFSSWSGGMNTPGLQTNFQKLTSLAFTSWDQ